VLPFLAGKVVWMDDISRGTRNPERAQTDNTMDQVVHESTAEHATTLLDAKNTPNENNESSDDDDLYQVNFPFANVDEQLREDADETKHPPGSRFVDENAILRCFDLSVSAHMQNTPVPRFEVTTSSGEDQANAQESKIGEGAAACGKANNESNENKPIEVAKSDPSTSQEQKMWTPAPVPLPPWVNHLR
jgi:hypothetical protein